MKKRIILTCCVFLAALGMGGAQPTHPFVCLSAPRLEAGWDQRPCRVVTARVEGRLSGPRMDAWLGSAFAACGAQPAFEWRDARLRIASGYSPALGGPPHGAQINIQGMVRYDARTGATELTLGFPSLPTEGW